MCASFLSNARYSARAYLPGCHGTGCGSDSQFRVDHVSARQSTLNGPASSLPHMPTQRSEASAINALALAKNFALKMHHSHDVASCRALSRHQSAAGMLTGHLGRNSCTGCPCTPPMRPAGHRAGQGASSATASWARPCPPRPSPKIRSPPNAAHISTGRRRTLRGLPHS